MTPAGNGQVTDQYKADAVYFSRQKCKQKDSKHELNLNCFSLPRELKTNFLS